ncbi:uncharacterized protein MAM_05019 [Metarhizium album ARSEF 1941]|uniref:DUF952 domain protein n=1 Tax=Metarhizium album (strain ARSEF 1941) TaxID=1081103 RepID=A0A0B2WVI2_METAS|nr:uncharacterized protein MAM_05019 [Metarhizium album ARSEF 1941]KHN96910.1 hypothetical protein MAM_05019 [Metarhizium album ARSEF 1941]
MSADSPPKHVYKIIPTAPPEPIPHYFPLSDLDRQDGFIHLSTAQQVPLTCGRFFSTEHALWVLKFQLDKFADPIKWDGGFPHLYGNFGGKDVLSVQKYERDEGRTWVEIMSASSWLE